MRINSKNNLKLIFIQFSVFEPLAKIGFSDNWKWWSYLFWGTLFCLILLYLYRCFSYTILQWVDPEVYIHLTDPHIGSSHILCNRAILFYLSTVDVFELMKLCLKSVCLTLGSKMPLKENLNWSPLQESHLEPCIFLCTWF